MTRDLQRWSPRAAAELVPAQGVGTPQLFAEAMELWASKRVNVLTPMSAIGSLPEDYGLTATAVVLDPDPDGADVYYSKLFHARGEVSVTRVGLDKLAAAIGISWHVSRRLDDGKTPHLCDWQVQGSYLTPYGERLALQANTRLDLRDGSAYIAPMKEGQLRATRAKLLERAESMCKNRAIRSLGLPAKMTQEQAARPFIAVKTICQPTDPETRRQMLLGASGTLSGALPAPPPAPVAARVIDVDETGHVTEDPDLPPAPGDDPPAPEHPDDPPF